MGNWRASLIVLLCIVALLFLSLGTPMRTEAASDEGSGDACVSDEVVVELVPGADLAALARQYALDPKPVDQFGAQPIYRLRILDGAAPKDKAAALKADSLGRVVYAEPNYIEQAPEGRARVLWASGEDAGLYVNQWAPTMIRLPEAHTITRGAGVKIAVLDTGVDTNHPALVGRLVAGYDFVDQDSDPSERGVYGVNRGFGHGTHVAGLVALAAPEAKIMPVRVLDANGIGNQWVLVKALAYAVDPDGDPATPDGADVINLSISSLSRSRCLRDVIRAVTCTESDHSSYDLPCLGRGAIVVAAAGNNASSTPEYPAGDGTDGTVSVGASTSSDATAAFSNFGSWVRVAAPGEGILSTVPGGGFGTWSGTSMAAPLVAGEAALVRAVYPWLSTSEVAKRIIETGAETDGEVRYRIDAAAAVGLAGARR
ncbi:MAG TPA: S8 family serine peptidase [Blastocatellia bacterium]|nr:S8 family serine peptidase [Blastocatellia bacterium]